MSRSIVCCICFPLYEQLQEHCKRSCSVLLLLCEFPSWLSHFPAPSAFLFSTSRCQNHAGPYPALLGSTERDCTFHNALCHINEKTIRVVAHVLRCVLSAIVFVLCPDFPRSFSKHLIADKQLTNCQLPFGAAAHCNHNRSWYFNQSIKNCDAQASLGYPRQMPPL